MSSIPKIYNNTELAVRRFECTLKNQNLSSSYDPNISSFSKKHMQTILREMFAWRRLPSEVSKAPALIKFVHFSLHAFDILLNVDSLSNIPKKCSNTEVSARGFKCNLKSQNLSSSYFPNISNISNTNRLYSARNVCLKKVAN